ncbi:MAG: hypothetical protein ACFB4I_21580, partial [Cyanophyceae cyanobacterium]
YQLEKVIGDLMSWGKGEGVKGKGKHSSSLPLNLQCLVSLRNYLTTFGKWDKKATHSSGPLSLYFSEILILRVFRSRLLSVSGSPSAQNFEENNE